MRSNHRSKRPLALTYAIPRNRSSSWLLSVCRLATSSRSVATLSRSLRYLPRSSASRERSSFTTTRSTLRAVSTCHIINVQFIVRIKIKVPCLQVERTRPNPACQNNAIVGSSAMQAGREYHPPLAVPRNFVSYYNLHKLNHKTWSVMRKLILYV
jgi:hypothetical protein